MVNPEKLNLQGATALVPAFSGGTESDLVSFFIFNNISDAIKPNILEAILAQLTGEALSAVRYKKITTWDKLKKLFKTVFGSAHSVSYLQMKLSQMRQNAKESIKDFSTRVEKTAHELTNALTVDWDAPDAEIIAGIPQTIGLLLKARNIQVFKEAVLNTMEEETTAEFYNNMSGDKSAIKCHRCEKFGHYANESRTSEQKIATFRNPNNGQSPKTEFKREYSSKFCKYCRKTNHDKSECRKLKRNEQNKTVVRNDQENHDRSISEIQSGSNVRIITPITQEHITCFSDKFQKSIVMYTNIMPWLKFSSLPQMLKHLLRCQPMYNQSVLDIYSVYFCPSMFSRKDNLLAHQKTHAGVCYPCTICLKTFNDQSNLNKHLKNVHGVHIINVPAHRQPAARESFIRYAPPVIALQIQIAPQIFVPESQPVVQP
ncbi:Uncharacterized protein FWK35_00006370 [Aphis craccivora]|uniref:C2H2-type domain-containing protein n=1 Tax=Aphis craccivora TaxID=307492 RepID=A0A6G0YGD2_APHCR|nr:Uncharacterized protein FWK35_00006370 [Aphis craccivora]